MTIRNFLDCDSNAPRLSTPIWGSCGCVVTIPLGIPKVGIPKGIAEAVFSLYHRLSRGELDSQPPPPNKLCTGGWELEGEVVVQGKNKKDKEQKLKNKSTAIRVSGADQMVQLTKRDEAMLDWLSVVRMADQEAVCWALAALPEGHADQPVGVRRGNQWIARLVEEGLAQPAFNDRSIIRAAWLLQMLLYRPSALAVSSTSMSSTAPSLTATPSV